MKARFTEEQPAVRWQALPDGQVDVTICINGEKVTETNTQIAEDKVTEITTSQELWEYDFNQFRTSDEKLTQAAVERNPAKYLNYTTKAKKTLEEMVQEQAEEIKMLKDCMIEMSEAVYE